MFLTWMMNSKEQLMDSVRLPNKEALEEAEPLNISSAPSILAFLERHPHHRLMVEDLTGEHAKPGVLVVDDKRQTLQVEFPLGGGRVSRYEVARHPGRFQMHPPYAEAYTRLIKKDKLGPPTEPVNETLLLFRLAVLEISRKPAEAKPKETREAVRKKFLMYLRALFSNPDLREIAIDQEGGTVSLGTIMVQFYMDRLLAVAKELNMCTGTSPKLGPNHPGIWGIQTSAFLNDILGSNGLIGYKLDLHYHDNTKQGPCGVFFDKPANVVTIMNGAAVKKYGFVLA